MHSIRNRFMCAWLACLLMAGSAAPALAAPEAAFDDAFLTYSLRLGSEYLKTPAQDNRLISPLSLYFALALLTEASQGESRAALLQLLGLADQQMLGSQTPKLMAAVTQSNGPYKMVPANSLWVNKSVQLKPEFLKIAQEIHQAQVDNVAFDESDLARIQQWASDKTQGLITPRVIASPNTLMLIVNALYFRDAWLEAFDRADTQPDAFTLADGTKKAEVPFMHRTDKDRAYVRGPNYLRAELALKNGGKMVFVLPDEGVLPSQLAQNPQALRQALLDGQTQYADIAWKLPRMDYATSIDVKRLLENMGAGMLFGSKADFSNVSAMPAFVSAIQQDNRVIMDEEEVQAASVTQIGMTMAAPGQQSTPPIVYMHLTRPFLCAIVSASGHIAFIGAVYQP